MMRPSGPDLEQVGNLTLKFETLDGETTLAVVSDDFPEFASERASIKQGYASEHNTIPEEIANELPYAVWEVNAASGRYAFETTSHSSRNGSGFGLLISSYRTTTVGSLPEDSFAYHAVGLCSRVRNTQ